jgi:hypothetical protein
MYKIFAVLTALCLMAVPCWAQLGDITASETTTVDLGGIKDGNDSSYTISAVVPYDKIGGGFQAFLSQQKSDGDITSENLNARVEGGFTWWKLEVAGFVGFERLFREGTNTLSVGPFFRLPEYIDGGLKVTSGFGSWLQNQETQAAVGESESLSAYSVRPFLYGAADYGDVNLFGKVSTDYQNLGDIEAEIVPSLVVKIDDRVSVGVLAQYRYSRLGDMGLLSRYSVVARMTF